MLCDDVRHGAVGDECVVRNAKSWGVSGSVAVSDEYFAYKCLLFLPSLT